VGEAVKEDVVNEPQRITGRMVWGLVVLALGVLWTLDNLGQVDASDITRWWPIIPLGWGLLLLSGANGRRKARAGWIWTAIGALAILKPLGFTGADLFDFWPLLLVFIGGSLVFRAWQGSESVSRSSGPRIDASAILAGTQRKVVTDQFSTADVNAVIAAMTLDLRPAKLIDGRGEIDVYAMWGGIDLMVPKEWRVVSEVTPILGVFQDATQVPEDPNAPTLVVRGSVVMGGIEVRNDDRKVFRTRTRGRDKVVEVGPGGVIRVGIIDKSTEQEKP
jgi:predicted membrane protein